MARTHYIKLSLVSGGRTAFHVPESLA